jgi:VanZ family protein
VRQTLASAALPVSRGPGIGRRPLLVGPVAPGHLARARRVTGAAATGGTGRATPVLAYAPALLWAALLLWLGGRSDVPSPVTDLPLDKLAHFVLYGVLGWLAAAGRERAGGPAAWIVSLLAIGCGVLDEIHQRTVPGRSAEVADAAVDAVAVILASAMVRRRARRRGKDA